MTIGRQEHLSLLDEIDARRAEMKEAKEVMT